MIAGLCTLLMHPARILRCGIVLKPLTLLHFHHVLTKRKYHMLFVSKRADKLCLVSLAEALSRAVPDTDCRVIL
jgi:predicted esterase